MRHVMILAALASMFVSQARAQTEAPPDSANLALARELVEVSGGQKAVEAQLRATVANIKAAYARSFDPKLTTAIESTYSEMEADLLKQAPKLIDIQVSIYARNFTRKELEDYLAWLKSDSGRAVVRKTPSLLQQINVATAPMVSDMLPKLALRAAEGMCEANHCTPEQRQRVEAAVAGLIRK